MAKSTWAYLELVETQDVRLRSKVAGYRLNWVATPMPEFLLHDMDALVHIYHEGVKVHSTLARDVWWERIIEQVHEHGLACSYVAVEVQPLWYLRRRNADLLCRPTRE